jgi:hypothetical protein
MLNSTDSEEYIQRIMDLSEEAQADIQNLIMRSKTNLNDLISQSQAQSENPFADEQKMSNIYLQNMEPSEPSNFEDNKSEAMSNNMLMDKDEDPSFVQDQIKKLDTLFDDQGLGGLNENFDPQKSFDRRKEKLMSHIFELEEDKAKMDEKCKEQMRINQELADKIQ